MNKKTKRILLFTYLLAFLVTSIGATMAFFLIRETSYVTPMSDIGSVTMTSILFNAGEPISIYASYDNFHEGSGNLSDDTTTSATLKKGSDVEKATFYYDVSINIEENTIVYSDDLKQAEILLTVIDPEGAEVTKIDGLKYVTKDGLSGFDITGLKGNYKIADKYEITSEQTDSVTQVWKIKLTFVNLEKSQDVNQGKGLNGYVQIEPRYEEGNENG